MPVKVHGCDQHKMNAKSNNSAVKFLKKPQKPLQVKVVNLTLGSRQGVKFEKKKNLFGDQNRLQAKKTAN